MENSEITMFRKTIRKKDDDTIFVKPLCDFFKLDYTNQVEKINLDHILKKQTGKKPDYNIFGDNISRAYLTKKGFVRWVEILNPNVIQKELRSKFELYQEMLFDFMYGSIEKEREMKVKVTRLHKLEKLYSKIGLEIKRIKSDVNIYLNERFVQTQIDFKEPKAIDKI